MRGIREQLQPDEQITYVARPTQLTLLPPLVATLAIIGATIAIYLQTGALGALWVGIVIGLIALVYLLQQFIVLKSNQYVVTSRRIIKQTGVFSKRSTDTYLDKINNVDHHQSLWGRILEYGTVEVDTASETGTTKFPMVARPIRFKQEILANAQRYRTGAIGTGAPLSGADRLRQLKKLLDDGLITQAEFDEKRRKLVEEL